MPTVPNNVNTSGYDPSPAATPPSPTQMMAAAADVASRTPEQRPSMGRGKGSAEPDLKANRRKKMKVVK